MSCRSAGMARMFVFSALALLLLSACCWADDEVGPSQPSLNPSLDVAAGFRHQPSVKLHVSVFLQATNVHLFSLLSLTEAASRCVFYSNPIYCTDMHTCTGAGVLNCVVMLQRTTPRSFLSLNSWREPTETAVSVSCCNHYAPNA